MYEISFVKLSASETALLATDEHIEGYSPVIWPSVVMYKFRRCSLLGEVKMLCIRLQNYLYNFSESLLKKLFSLFDISDCICACNLTNAVVFLVENCENTVAMRD